MSLPEIKITHPSWVAEFAPLDRRYANDGDKMDLAIELARQNVSRETGGPFGAAVYEMTTGRLVAVGVNLVVRHNNCALHGEMVAYMTAQARLKSWTLAAEGFPPHEIFTSCEPCAMCLGATLWSGVKRLVYAATRDDACQLSFDEGPVFPESYRYLAERGIEIKAAFKRDEAREVLEMYRARSGVIYNACE